VTNQEQATLAFAEGTDAAQPAAGESAAAEAPAARDGGDATEGEAGGRRGRSRDRFRRERRPDDEVGEAAAAQAAAAENVPLEALVAEETAASVPEQTAAAVAPVAAPPVAAAAAAPVVAAYVLPTEELQQVAQACGLEWVNSDADKIAAAQAAIAATPAPVHVPRERKPVVVVDEGPLVLVETRKDLSQLRLPFDQNAPAAEARAETA
jgi:ribonuclease E